MLVLFLIAACAVCIGLLLAQASALAFAVAVLCAERILIFVFYGEHGVRLVACSCVLSQLGQVRVVRIVLDHSLLRGVTVMH